MALTGHLSDLSLSELIEFFCNQRKTGRLCVLYPQGRGCFYLQSGSVVDAEIGVLRGIDAVYYALTLPNAAFEFKAIVETPERTINQPWTQVVLEGLRRLDEGITPTDAFPDGPVDHDVAHEHVAAPPSPPEVHDVPAFLSLMSLSPRKPVVAGAVAVAVLLSVAAIGVPAGWYGRNKPAANAGQPNVQESSAAQPVKSSEATSNAPVAAPTTDTHEADAAALAAKRQREKDRTKLREERASAAENAAKLGTTPAPQTASSSPEVKSGPKKATVQVSYDESGRVTQASGSDPTAVRIARQKHFPPGKAGTATVTVPIN
jgi:hypothetical protein